MENTELIKALKEDAEWAHANEWETPITLGDHLDAAVNALESLTAQLSESQRRERAAVEDLHHNDACLICIGSSVGVEGCKCECLDCKLNCRCKDCRDEDKWQWRGNILRR